MLQTITGDDTLVIQDRVMVDLSDGDVSSITFPNNLAEVKTGKNGNTMYVKNTTGENADLTIRVVRASDDDIFLQGLLASQIASFNEFTLLQGTFVKKLGDGAGSLNRDEYTLTGGIFLKPVETKENVEGDVEQAISIYNMRFSKAVRSVV